MLGLVPPRGVSDYLQGKIGSTEKNLINYVL